MIRTFLLAACFVAAAAAAAAQESIEREVNVTRAYEPSVSDFLKQQIAPDLTDTTRMDPEYNYDVKPRPLAAHLGMSPIGLVPVTATNNLLRLPFYLKVGGGAPAQSTLLMSLARQYEKGSAGFTLNHYGHYGKIENESGDKAPATQTFNSARAFGDRRIGRDLTLEGELGYEFNRVSRYGYMRGEGPLPAATDLSAKGLGQYFNILRGRVKIGNSFTDLSKINWSLLAEETYVMDRFGYDIGGFKGRLEVGFRAGEGSIRLNGQFNNTDGNNEMAGYGGNFASAGVLYSYSGSNGFKISIGSDFARDITGKINNFMPQLNMEMPVAGSAGVLFAELQSTNQPGNYLTQALVNPYIVPGAGAPRSYTWDARAGVKGALFRALNYKIYGGYGYIENLSSYVNHYDLLYAGNAFVTIADTVSVWRAGAQADLKVTEAFDLYGSVEYRSFDTRNYTYVGGMPDFEASFGARYDYRGKFHAAIDAVLYGERLFYEDYGGPVRPTVKSDPMMEVNLSLDYFIDRRLGLFVDINNLLNQKLYRFNRFPLLGINGMAGVKLSF